MLSIPTVVSTFWETSEGREPVMCSGFARLPDLCILETGCQEGNELDMWPGWMLSLSFREMDAA